jgi:hypothetical protein
MINLYYLQLIKVLSISLFEDEYCRIRQYQSIKLLLCLLSYIELQVLLIFYYDKFDRKQQY